MKIFAISDLHLGEAVDKPMDIFGGNWVGGYWEKIKTDWVNKVSDSDVVIVAGDISWGMTLAQAKNDLTEISLLPGNKIFVRGNHDYWWNSLKKMNELSLNKVFFLQNNAVKIDDTVFCGTRGWTVPETNDKQTDDDKKIFDREILRLNLTLSEANKIRENNKCLCIMHFPPFNSKFEDSAFTKIISQNNIQSVVYGHLHGNFSRYQSIVTKEGIPYYLTSCDFLNNTLLQIY